ncbi:peptide deformylase [Aliikangiella marina]|uniref:Peptide deformylase n=1 Tax=Aliikangiella marina TaxID=1712262 RepID=A0A545T1A2_9GAMM|nr:peptide deformylase [Aliikangiella marina]TQV70990.1 peptide deformylase [Aliikangiella marina]
MAVQEIIKLGNPKLLQKSDPVEIGDNQLIKVLKQNLADTARAFNRQYGWGRAISAIQIGVAKRVIYMAAPEKILLINPEVIDSSNSMIEIWDDCMSFPDLMVKVKRHESFKIHYLDENWQTQERLIEGAMSELLQHELDHLNGIVATMRAIDGSQIALQSEKHHLDATLFANKT